MEGAALLYSTRLGPIPRFGLNVTVWTRSDRLGFGLVACRRPGRPLWDLADHLHTALAEREMLLMRLKRAGSAPRCPLHSSHTLLLRSPYYAGARLSLAKILHPGISRERLELARHHKPTLYRVGAPAFRTRARVTAAVI